MLEPIIRNSARKHGISDESIRHAFQFFIAQFVGTDDLPLLIGPDQSGNLIEVGYVTDDQRIIIVHAMKARSKYRYKI